MFVLCFAASAAMLLSSRVASAQILAIQANGGFAFAAGRCERPDEVQPSFNLPTQAADVKDALDEFFNGSSSTSNGKRPSSRSRPIAGKTVHRIYRSRRRSFASQSLAGALAAGRPCRRRQKRLPLVL